MFAFVYRSLVLFIILNICCQQSPSDRLVTDDNCYIHILDADMSKESIDETEAGVYTNAIGEIREIRCAQTQAVNTRNESSFYSNSIID
jgi:hypothetical protein